MNIKEIVEQNLNSVINNMYEVRKTQQDEYGTSVVFKNGWVASILNPNVNKNQKYSVAVCDYDGYFYWDILKPFKGFTEGVCEFDTEKEVCELLNQIKKF